MSQAVYLSNCQAYLSLWCVFRLSAVVVHAWLPCARRTSAVRRRGDSTFRSRSDCIKVWDRCRYLTHARTRSVCAENPDGRQGQGRHGRPRSVRPVSAGVGAGGRRPGAGLEGSPVPAGQQGRNGHADGRGRAGRDPAYLDGGRAEPGTCPPLLLGRRGDALDRGSRPRLFRGRPRQVRPGQFPGRGRQSAAMP